MVLGRTDFVGAIIIIYIFVLTVLKLPNLTCTLQSLKETKSFSYSGKMFSTSRLNYECGCG